MRFPASAIASNGATRRFTYRIQAPHDAPLFVANCTIPATPEAVDVMYRLFFIDSRSQPGRGGKDDGLAIMSTCPPAGCVTLEPIVVIGYPSSGAGSTRGDDCNWYNTFGCDTSMLQWYENEGGYSSDPGWEQEGKNSGHPDCDPATSECHQPLTAADSTTLLGHWNLMRSSFSDPAAERYCTELRATFELAISRGNVYRGETGLPDGDIKHAGVTYAGDIHIDGEILDRAADPNNPAQLTFQKTVLEIALHEAAHWSGYPPHGPDETWGNYTTTPYNYATGGGGVEKFVS